VIGVSIRPRRTEYITYYTILTPDALGNRRKVVDVWGDVVYIDTVGTNADLSKLFIGVDDKDLLPASLTPVIDLKPSFFNNIRLEWDSVNDGRTLVLVIGREASMRIEPPRPVDVIADHSGIKDILSKLTFDAYSNLKIDNANYEAMAPTDIQAVYKAKATLFSGTVSTSGNTADIDVSNFTVLEIEVKVTGVAGVNPSLDVYIEGKFEDTGDYKVLASQGSITSTGAWFLTITKLAFRYIRVRWDVKGTNPSFTIIVTAHMCVV
jgi:hypothetical protein